MDGDVKTHEFPELRVSETNLVSVVRTVVKGAITCGHGLVVAILVLEDYGCNSRHLSAEIQAVLERRFPVLRFVHAAMVGMHEVALGLASQDTHGELSHSVHVLRERFNHGLLFNGKLTSVEELFLEACDLRLGRQFTSEQKPQDALRDGLAARHGRGGLVHDVEKLGATVRDALCRVELGRLIHHAWDATHATNDLGDGDVADDSVGVLLSEGHDLLLAISNHSLHAFTENNRGEVAAGECRRSSLEYLVHHHSDLVVSVKLCILGKFCLTKGESIALLLFL